VSPLCLQWAFFERKCQAEIESLREKALEVDVWKQKALTLEGIAVIDRLTGLYNRRAFEDYLTLILSPETDPSAPRSLLMIDMDNFKDIFSLISPVLFQAGYLILQSCKGTRTFCNYAKVQIAQFL
jgi:GGDEF domain-containing protein